jgi:cysteine desulfurase
VETTTVVSAIRADTTLVSVMHVNNETGVVQDIDALAEACRSRGILFHTDAAQSAAYLPIDVRAVEPALLSLSAHKMYGPKGIGALFVSEALGAGLEPVTFGGDQERGMRPGTVPTHQVFGFGKAAELARLRRAEDAIRIAGLRDELWARLSSLQDVWRNGAAGPCAPHIVNVTFGGVEGESLLHELDDLIVSSGAACASGRGEPSPVLRVLGRSDALAQSSIRFSLGRQTTVGEIEIATAAIHRGIARLRAIAPGRRDSHELLAAH